LIRKNSKIKNLLSFFSVLLIILLSSHPLHSIFDLDVKLIFIILIILLFILFLFFRRQISKKIIYWIFFFNILILVNFFLTQSYLMLQLCLFVTIIFFLAFQTSELIFTKKNINFLYWISLLLCLGAWIGFFYAKYGGEGEYFSLYDKWNLDTKKIEYFFYLTTFTNSVNENFIRPSGIFEEPGALVLFVTFVIVFMEINEFSKLRSLLLLILLCITSSLMAYVLLFLFIFLRFKKFFPLFSFFVLFFLLLSNFSQDSAEYFFRYSNLNDLIYNNRTQQIIAFFQDIDFATFMLGAHTQLTQSESSHSSSPFTILWHYGIFVWIQYFIIEYYLIYKFFFGNKKTKFCSLALFLTLLQRPFIYSLYWSLILIYPIIVLYKKEIGFINKMKNKI